MQDRKSIFVVNSFQINLSPLQKKISLLCCCCNVKTKRDRGNMSRISQTSESLMMQCTTTYVLVYRVCFGKNIGSYHLTDHVQLLLKLFFQTYR